MQSKNEAHQYRTKAFAELPLTPRKYTRFGLVTISGRWHANCSLVRQVALAEYPCPGIN
jgi:hypothetical protein